MKTEDILCLVDSATVDPRFSFVRPHSMGETRFLCVVGKPFKKTVWSRHLFLFYFKGEKQNKKEKPKM